MNFQAAGDGWIDANQRLLGAEMALLRHRLDTARDPDPDPERTALETAVLRERAAMPAPAALDILGDLFGLSPFERQLLLLASAVELDTGIATACARLQAPRAQPGVSFSLALAVLSDPHWSAVTPEAPLRRWRLLELESGAGLVSAALRVDERVLHFLVGINSVDARLRPLFDCPEAPSLMAAEHLALVDRIGARLAGCDDARPVVHLTGNDVSGQRDVAARVAAGMGRELLVLRTDDIPAAAGPEQELMQVLCEREMKLLPAVLLVQASDASPAGHVARFLDGLGMPVLFASREPPTALRVFDSFRIDKPSPAGQKQLWLQGLGSQGHLLNGGLDALAGQFRLSARAIATISGAFDVEADGAGQLWRACRGAGRDRLDELAQRIEPAAGWDDLVLPPAQSATLRQLSAHLRQRTRVYEEWGFAGHGSRGLGVSALFCGESGTGKTLAAEVIANELRLDLYRIDLSMVVSKYIGETEKNLRRVFDAAEDTGAILLFDEADALFGKRSEVKDSHDRYANIEVSYLLQRMEAYRGLAILTSNMKSALDSAFHRRLRFIVNFPFPDADLRQAIWRRTFPDKLPLGDIDYRRLACLNLPGGNIRNIALNAAFLAAEAGVPLAMAHLLSAARSESAKLERPLSESETRGWV